MMKKIKLAALTASVLLFASLSLWAPAKPASAVDCSQTNLTTQQAIQCGSNGANGSQSVTDTQMANAADSFNNIISTILNILTVLVGVVAVIMIVLAGYRFITSGGNPEKVKSARNALLYAIIGIVIAALAQVIAQFVINRSVNSDQATGSKGSSSSSSQHKSASGSGCRPGQPC